MYKLMAADDEVMELEFIKFCLSNSKLPVQLVGTATDGEKAISLVEDLRPEIILLDIKMPKISGIEVGKYVAEKYPRAKVIMLTAYDKFDFAREAIRFNAFDYLLKPVKPEHFIEVVEKAIEKINQERFHEEAGKRRDSLLRALKPAILQKAITSLITVGKFEPAILLDEGYLSGNHRHEQKECVLVGCMSLWEKASGKSLTDYALLESIIKDLNNKFKDGLFVIADGLGKIVFYSERYNLSYSKLKSIESLVEENGYNCALFLCKIKQLSNAPEAFQYASSYCEYNAFWGNAGIFFVENYLKKSTCNFNSVREIEGKLLKNYFSSNSYTLRNDIDQILTAIFEAVKVMKPDPDQCKSYFEELVTLIAWAFIEKKVEIEALEILKTQANNKIRHANNYREVFAALHAFNESILDILLQPEVKNANQVVFWIKSYLQTNYQENITLEHLAEKVYLSPCYISRIFRQITGLNFMQYLTGIRMERAIELLKTGKYCVSEVAEAVGYKDSSYFSQVFKKRYGFNPNELIKKPAKMTI
ncbi:response regulator [Desulfallas sp. Bu1-1]|uniref:response regulator transcription factor n=1 Tax=Desulfallas sp. Bu1-1 TaxID=2787620 RepID=UPI0018A07ACE|nr:response regulator [Desulfallas sp. Bu1-1]MBF7082770.1 response regulator [Desulfallas sp. Bu1-1]